MRATAPFVAIRRHLVGLELSAACRTHQGTYLSLHDVVRSWVDDLLNLARTLRQLFPPRRPQSARDMSEIEYIVKPRPRWIAVTLSDWSCNPIRLLRRGRRGGLVVGAGALSRWGLVWRLRAGTAEAVEKKSSPRSKPFIPPSNPPVCGIQTRSDGRCSASYEPWRLHDGVLSSRETAHSRSSGKNA